MAARPDTAAQQMLIRRLFLLALSLFVALSALGTNAVDLQHQVFVQIPKQLKRSELGLPVAAPASAPTPSPTRAPGPGTNRPGPPGLLPRSWISWNREPPPVGLREPEEAPAFGFLQLQHGLRLRSAVRSQAELGYYEGAEEDTDDYEWEGGEQLDSEASGPDTAPDDRSLLHGLLLVFERNSSQPETWVRTVPAINIRSPDPSLRPVPKAEPGQPKNPAFYSTKERRRQSQQPSQLDHIDPKYFNEFGEVDFNEMIERQEFEKQYPPPKDARPKAPEDKEPQPPKIKSKNKFSWCDLTNPLGNPFCPFPLPWFIFFNFLVKTLVPSLIAPVFETFAEEFMGGQQGAIKVAHALLLELGEAKVRPRHSSRNSAESGFPQELHPDIPDFLSFLQTQAVGTRRRPGSASTVASATSVPSPTPSATEGSRPESNPLHDATKDPAGAESESETESEDEDPERQASRRRARLETFQRLTDELREGLVQRFRLDRERQLPQYAWRLITQRRSREERRLLLDNMYEAQGISGDGGSDAVVPTLDEIYAQEMSKVTARSLASYRAHEQLDAFAEPAPPAAGQRRGKALLPALTATLYSDLRGPLLQGALPAVMERYLSVLVPPLFDALDDQLALQVPPRVADPIHAHLVRNLPEPVAQEVAAGLLSTLPAAIAHKIWGASLPFLVRGVTHSVAEAVALSLAMQPAEVLACARCEAFPFPERMGPHPGSAFAGSASAQDLGPEQEFAQGGLDGQFASFPSRLRRLWTEFGYDPGLDGAPVGGDAHACELCAAHRRARPDLEELQTLAWHWSAWFSDQCLARPELRF